MKTPRKFTVCRFQVHGHLSEMQEHTMDRKPRLKTKPPFIMRIQHLVISRFGDKCELFVNIGSIQNIGYKTPKYQTEQEGTILFIKQA